MVGALPTLRLGFTVSFPMKSYPTPSFKLLSNRRQTGCILLRKGVISYNLYQQANKSVHLSTSVPRRVKGGL